jgi:hypothetical protein
LAPSSIPGAGLGIFAGNRCCVQGETVGMGDLVIPIVDHGDWEGGSFLWDEGIPGALAILNILKMKWMRMIMYWWQFSNLKCFTCYK